MYGDISLRDVTYDLYPTDFLNETGGIGLKGMLGCYCTQLLYGK